MFGIEHYPLFILSGVLLNITPGQDTFYIVGRSMAQGRAAGGLLRRLAGLLFLGPGIRLALSHAR